MTGSIIRNNFSQGLSDYPYTPVRSLRSTPQMVIGAETITKYSKPKTCHNLYKIRLKLFDFLAINKDACLGRIDHLTVWKCKLALLHPFNLDLVHCTGVVE